MSTLWKLVKRNKRKLAVLAVFIGAGLSIRKLSSVLFQLHGQVTLDKSLQFRIQKAEYFQTMLSNTKNILQNFYKVMELEVDRCVDPDHLAEKLQFRVGSETSVQLDAATKLELFSRMKVATYTKLCLLINCWSFLSVSVSLQMAVLAGYLFQAHVKADPGTSHKSSWGILSALVDSSAVLSNLTTTLQSLFTGTQASQVRKTEPGHDFLSSTYQTQFVNVAIRMLKEQMPALEQKFSTVVQQHLGRVSLKTTISSTELLELVEGLMKELRPEFEEICVEHIDGAVRNLDHASAVSSPVESFTGLFQSTCLDQMQQLTASLTRRVCSNELLAQGISLPLAKLLPFVWNIDHHHQLHSDVISPFLGARDFRCVLFCVYEQSLGSCDTQTQ